ncbi:hypothetical protein SALBM311S_06676 [Streptomyces alboniger]
MCQSVVTPDIPLLGSVSLILKAGGGSTPVQADNLYIDVEDLSADATFENIDIGVAGKDLSKGPGIKSGDSANPFGFAQQADKATLTDVKQTAWATTAGTFKLSGLKRCRRASRSATRHSLMGGGATGAPARPLSVPQ